MRWLAVSTFLLVLAVALAGCGKKSSGANEVQLADGERISLDLPEEQRPEEDGILGAVSGVVINDAVYPIPGAKVAIVGRPYETVADEEGLFQFLEMPPGLYTIQASMDGHATGVGTLNVKSGQVTKSVLMATRLPYQGPYHVTHTLEEYRSASPLDPMPYHVVALDMPPAGAVIESVWEGLQPTVGDALLYTITPETNATARTQGQGPNPLRVELAADWFPNEEYAIRVQVAPDQFALPPDVTGRSFVTLFYVDPPPADWSFLAGDP